MLLVLVGRGAVSTSSLDRVVDPSLVAMPVLAAIALAALVIRLVADRTACWFEGEPATMAVDQADTGRGYGPATSVDRHCFADCRDRDVLVVDVRLRLDPSSRISRPGRVRCSVRLSSAARRLTGPTTDLGPQRWLVDSRAGDHFDRRASPRRVGANHCGDQVQTVELLGLNPNTLANLHGWRSSFGAAPRTLAKKIDQPAPGPLGTIDSRRRSLD